MNDYKEVVDHVEMPERAGELRVKEQPPQGSVIFKIGDVININGVHFLIRKVTPKDIVLRPKSGRVRVLKDGNRQYHQD